MIEPLPLVRGESALRRVRSPLSVARLATALKWILLAAILVLALVPWQQTSPGFGRVIAYAPLEREQPVEAPIDGRIKHWAVQEGQEVKAGQLIAEVADNDPEILERLQQELDAAHEEITAGEASMAALNRQAEALALARDRAIAAAEAKIRVSEQKEQASRRALEAARAGHRAARLNLKRRKGLRGQGLASERDLELAELSEAKARTDVAKARAAVEGAKGDVLTREAEREEKAADAEAKIAKVIASAEKARVDVAKSRATAAKVAVRLSRQSRMQVTAPRDGTILRLLARQGTEWVKAGDPIAVLVPDTVDRAVEMWVSGNDAPLVQRDQKVRLQFEGWPALQFSGWPSVAVGTFGGVVAFADATADPNGRFRIVVVPDPADDPWPDTLHLRQGVRANGWVMLSQVTLGFEVWRQLNGFPPQVEVKDRYGAQKSVSKKSDKPDKSKDALGDDKDK